MQHSMKMLAALGVAALALTGCAAGDAGAPTDGEPIVIGTSLPMTGPLASFGPILEAGYLAAVDEVNAAGGIEIDGSAREVELVVLDSGSDPNTVADQARTRVLQDGAVGLLGSVSPGLTIPASNVADLEGVPMVSSLTPNGAWAAGNPDGWQYAWNFFMDENQLADVAYETADLTDTNKKVAIFADTEEDGVATGALYESAAVEYGYEIVYRADNPAGTTDFTADINAAKAAGAEVLLAILIPPDSFALWKQMAALQWVPEIAVCQKCSSTAAFQAELGDLAEGTLNVYLANPSEAPEWADIVATFSEQYGVNVDRNSALAAYTAAMVLLESIAEAGSTDGAAINEVIAATDKEYPVGLVKFRDDHSVAVNVANVQWFGDEQLGVFPVGGEADLVTPTVGLQQ